MSDALLREIRDLIQQDVNQRGLATDPEANLINACPDDFAAACQSVAEAGHASLCVVTGFYIAHADPPCGETDGPLGALFLARALAPFGIGVELATDEFCRPALHAGLDACGLLESTPLFSMTASGQPNTRNESLPKLTHLISLERVGPSHTLESLRRQPGYTRRAEDLFRMFTSAASCDRPHSMRGRDLSAYTAPLHIWFEFAARHSHAATIGIGDGGNEIGMGKVPWDVIRRNIPNGGLIACRVPTDHLIVCGVSNWGAYALAAGVALLRGAKLDPSLFDVERERELLRIMVEKGPLVDGVVGRPSVSVDGLPFDEYVKPLRRIKDIFGVVIMLDLRDATGAGVRQAARRGEWNEPTAGLARGFVQANLVVVPRDLAFDFLLFCQRNPKPCPLLDVTEPGSAEARWAAPGADVYTDAPRYCVYEHGELTAEPPDLLSRRRDDLIGFLLGCSFTFEHALREAGVPVRHIEQGRNVPMYRTSIACRPAGAFRGPMVVSMRPMTPAQAITATRVCTRFPRAHGTPIHFGDPEAIGIRDIARPDFGDAVDVRPGETPVFWACGVTPQAAAMEARPPLLMTHKPGHMFVTDLRDADLEGEERTAPYPLDYGRYAE